MPLGVDCVDREAGFARSRHAGANSRLVSRKRNRQIFQIVLPGADDGDRIRIIRRLQADSLTLGFTAFRRCLAFPTSFPQRLRQSQPGCRRLVSRNFLRRALAHDETAAVAAFRPEIDDPVAGLDHVEIVLDDHNRVAAIDEAVQDFQQAANVLEVQAGGRLVENVHGASGGLLDQFAGQLDALRLAAGERGARLSQLDVVQPHVVQRLEHGANSRHVVEVLQCLLHVHVQRVCDRLALVADLKRLAPEAFSAANRACDPHIGQKVHLDAIGAVALTGFTTPAAAPSGGYVETETARFVAAQLGVGQLGEE